MHVAAAVASGCRAHVRGAGRHPARARGDGGLRRMGVSSVEPACRAGRRAYHCSRSSRRTRRAMVAGCGDPAGVGRSDPCAMVAMGRPLLSAIALRFSGLAHGSHRCDAVRSDRRGDRRGSICAATLAPTSVLVDRDGGCGVGRLRRRVGWPPRLATAGVVPHHV